MIFFKRRSELVEGAFFYSADVGAGYVQLFGGLALGECAVSIKTVAHYDYLSLSRIKDGAHVFESLFHADLLIDVLYYIFVTADNVYVGEGIAVSVYVNGVVDGYLV